MLDEELTTEISKDLPDIECFFISAVAETGLVELKDHVWKLINKE